MLTLAGQAKPGAGGVICLPFFAGERSPNWNLNARAAFFGMTIGHDMKHLCRSLIEGIAFRLRNLNDVLTPIAANAAVYDRVYPLYLRLHQALMPSFDEVADFQKELCSQGG